MEDPRAFEDAIGLSTNGMATEPAQGFFAQILTLIERDEKNYLWYTDWQVIARTKNAIVGGFTFKRPPQDGVVEIGYGLAPCYRGQGFMTEAVSRALHWALSTGYVDRVIAKTAKDNIPSMRVLQRVGMTQYDENAELTYWHKTHLAN